MFLVEDPVAAAEIALGLAEASRDAARAVRRAGRPGARVRCSSGRATPTGRPSTWPAGSRPSPTRAAVVVSPELRAALEDRPRAPRSGTMRPRYLKNIGRVSLSVVRRSDDARRRPSARRSTSAASMMRDVGPGPARRPGWPSRPRTLRRRLSRRARRWRCPRAELEACPRTARSGSARGGRRASPCRPVDGARCWPRRSG